MEQTIRQYFQDLTHPDKNIQYEAFVKLFDITERPVDWAYEVWDQLITDLTAGDNHQRSRVAQFLCNLSISDPEKRILQDFPKIWTITKDKQEKQLALDLIEKEEDLKYKKIYLLWIIATIQTYVYAD